MGRDHAFPVTLELTAYVGQTLKQNTKYKTMVNAKEKIKWGRERANGEGDGDFKLDG